MLYVLDTPVLSTELTQSIIVDANEEKDFKLKDRIQGRMRIYTLYDTLYEQDRSSYTIAFLIEDCRCFSSALLYHHPSPRYVWMPLHEGVPYAEELCEAFTKITTVPVEIITTPPYRVVNSDWNEGTRWVRVKDNDATVVNMSAAIIIARTLSIGFIEAFLKPHLDSVTMGENAEETVARWMQVCYTECTRADLLPGDLTIGDIPVWMLPEERFRRRIKLFVEDPHPNLRDCIGWGFVMHYHEVQKVRWSRWSGGNLQTSLRTNIYTAEIVRKANEYAKGVL